MISIAIERPDRPDVVSLVDELDAYQKPLYPAESHHGIDIDALGQPGVLFAVVRGADGSAIACGAVVLGSGYGELKRMFVRPQHRGQSPAGERSQPKLRHPGGTRRHWRDLGRFFLRLFSASARPTAETGIENAVEAEPELPARPRRDALRFGRGRRDGVFALAAFANAADRTAADRVSRHRVRDHAGSCCFASQW